MVGAGLNAHFSPDGRWLATATDWPGFARVWTVPGLQLSQRLAGHLLGVKRVAFSPDGRRIATGGTDAETLKLWDPETGRELVTLSSGSLTTAEVQFSADGSTLAAEGLEGEIYIWWASLSDDDPSQLSHRPTP